MTETFVYRYRRTAIVVFELALVVFSNYLAFWLRFDGDIPGVSESPLGAPMGLAGRDNLTE